MTDDTPPPPDSRRCTAWTRRGMRCERHDVGPDGLCLVHTSDPARCALWEAARARGLVAARVTAAATREERLTRQPTDPDDACPPLERSLEGVTRFLGWIAVQVAAGKMPPKQGSTATYAMTSLRAALVARDLEVQLKAARAELKLYQAAQRKGAH